ncbi:MAG TPA: hypothetical protein DEA08_35220 [Planctomycetes bacterium]|nr:hypothetical protein [Planctomycetota bacterium]
MTTSPSQPRAFARALRLVPAVALACGAGLIALETHRVQAGPSGRKGTSEAKAKRSVPATKDVVRKIDDLLASKWREAKVNPARRTDDAEFLRRITLDLTGSIPSEELTRRFLASKKHGKRGELIDELLASKAYGRMMAQRWAILLVGREYMARQRGVKALAKRLQQARKMMGSGEDMEGMEGGYDLDSEVLTFSEWLERSFDENRPFDAITSDLISAEGKTIENPAVHYMLRFARNGKAPEATGHVMRVFQGLQIQCAQCHDDKYEPEWTQRVFWGVAAFFARTSARRVPPPGMTLREARKSKNKVRYYGFEIFDRPAGQIRIPAPPGETGRLVLPEFLTGDVISPSNQVDRREELAKIMTSRDNPYFAKAIVNRVWSFFFERGIINPVDAINQTDYDLPELMALLEQDFRDSGYDLRRLVEIVVKTRAYELSSEGREKGRDEAIELFARAPLRTLSAEQLFYSVVQATGIEDVGNGNRRARRVLERMKFQILRQFLKTFGTDDEDSEELEEGTIPQALMRINGKLTNDAVRPRPGHPVYDRLFRMKRAKDVIDTIYLRVLSRYPSDAERRKVSRYLGRPESKRAAGKAQAVADVFWALLNGTEFNLNH